MRNPWEWTEDDLQKLIGQYESMRLEFKASALFSESPEKVKDKLSRLVSAFANSEGGTIIIGIKEEKGKGKADIASSIDNGVDLKEYPQSWLQGIITANISPFLPGIRVRPIPLSGNDGRVAYVIYIPNGSTAYQASDKIYYSRSEYQVNPMPDHEIRLRMMKGQRPQATVEIVERELLTADEEYEKRQIELKSSRNRRRIIGSEKSVNLRSPKRDFDELSFQLKVINTGEVTLKDFLLVVMAETVFELLPPCGFKEDVGEAQFRFADTETRQKNDTCEYILPDKKVFPNQGIIFPQGKWSLKIPSKGTTQKLIPPNKCILRWIIYLDNAPPSKGELFLFEGMANAVHQILC